MRSSPLAMTDPVGKPGDAPMRVLLVEDHVDSRHVLAALLRREGYLVYEAAAGDEAMSLLHSTLRVDAVVTDVIMPGSLDGMELAEYITIAWPHLALVVISGSDYARRAENRSLVFLRKPYRPESLLESLSQVLGMQAVVRGEYRRRNPGD